MEFWAPRWDHWCLRLSLGRWSSLSMAYVTWSDKVAATWSKFYREVSVNMHLGTKSNDPKVILLCSIHHCSVLPSYLLSQQGGVQEEAGGFDFLPDFSDSSCWMDFFFATAFQLLSKSVSWWFIYLFIFCFLCMIWKKEFWICLTERYICRVNLYHLPQTESKLKVHT